ncbi:MAG: DUF58 domain-containing protein, partial [Deltaproteobacteria bacterium]|nr:DUF58 domain-containing protein [Deltaproteobacteria bacterium]
PVEGDGISHPQGRPRGDLVELRRYHPGDPLRYLLWKVFARTRRLIVRAPEQAVIPAQRTLAYLIAGVDDEPAAAAARLALEAGALGSDWLFGADGTAQPTSALDQALRAVARSAAVSPEQRAALGGFLAATRGSTASRLVLFAPAASIDWLDGVLGALRARPLPTMIILGAERLSLDDDAKAQGLLRRLLWHSAPARHHLPARRLEPLQAALAAAGIEWALLERSSGKTWLPGHFGARREGEGA